MVDPVVAATGFSWWQWLLTVILLLLCGGIAAWDVGRDVPTDVHGDEWRPGGWPW